MQTEAVNEKKIRYCIITKNSHDLDCAARMESVGFYQWLNVFDGEIYESGAILPGLKDGDFDLIHVRVTPQNLQLIHDIKNCIGEKSKTRLVVSMDVPYKYWNKKFVDLKRLEEAVKRADLVLATEYTICRALESLSAKPVYELQYPADLNKIRSSIENNENIGRENVINVLYKHKIGSFLWLKSFMKRFTYKVRVIFYKDYDERLVKKLEKYGVEAVICHNEEEFCNALAQAFVFVAPYGYSNYGKWVIYAAALGVLTIGNHLLDSSRRCYPFIYTDVYSMRACKKAAYFRMVDREYLNYICENASKKVEYYNWYNMKDRFLNILSRETGESKFVNSESVSKDKEAVVFSRDICHLWGKTDFTYNLNELMVVCLVKNGMEYMEAFLNHYNSLGVKHFVFIDNCSTDGTVEYLINRENITVFKTQLLHKHYENEIRRTVIESLMKNRWCLCVDIDEFFDYPCSDKITVSQFLDYLNRNKYTAVIVYMLDMFSKESEASDMTENYELTEKYCYYDISGIKKEGYLKHNPNFCKYNLLSKGKMKNYYGGVRRKRFGKRAAKYMLIKHPLMFIDRNIEPVTDPHYCNKAYIADVNCLLKHYKFTDTFKTRLGKMVNDYSFFGKAEHEEYSRILESQGGINLFTSSARKLDNIEELCKSGFLKVSRAYREHVKGNELSGGKG
jgi:F0F1-type ATP synthase delta subunit